MAKEEAKRLNLRNPKIYNPPAEEKTYKTPKIVKLILTFIIILIFLSIIVYFTPLFKIQSVTVIGTLPPDAQTFLDNFKDQNIFLVRSQNIADTLTKRYPEFSGVSVYKGIPNILKVEFDERAPVLIWQSSGHTYLVDESGLAYKEIGSTTIKNLLIVNDLKNIALNPPAQVVTENYIKFITDAKARLKEVGINVKGFEVNETFFQTDAVTDKNLRIKFDITRTLSDQMDAFSKVYPERKAQIKQYIDLRVPGKVYYQ